MSHKLAVVVQVDEHDGEPCLFGTLVNMHQALQELAEDQGNVAQVLKVFLDPVAEELAQQDNPDHAAKSAH